MRMISAELLKIRRRTATWVVLCVPIVLVALVTVSIVASGEQEAIQMIGPFPQAYQASLDYAFGGLGTLLAMAYASALAGADWNWGVLRNVIARGESRVGYILAKAVAIAIALTVGVVIVSLAALAAILIADVATNTRFGNPFSGQSLAVLRDQFLFGLPVLFERAAIGFATAVVLRSQVAGVVAGIVLFIGESIISSLLTFSSIAGRLLDPDLPPAAVQWFQFLPFRIGDEVRAAATSASLTPTDQGDILGLFLTRVELPVALAVLLLYLFGALAIASFFVRREQVVA